MEIKVISFNIWDGGRLLRDAIAFIEEEKPDIIGIQEVYDGQDPSWDVRYRSLELITKLLDYPYHDFAPEFIEVLPVGRVPQGNLILSKFPIKDRHTKFFDRPLDENFVDIEINFPTISHNLHHVVIDTPRGDLHFVNFHGVWDLEGDNDSEARRKMVSVLLEDISECNPLIITGDTNARPTNPAMQPLNELLHNVFGTSITSTFNMKQKTNPGYATSIVDMIYLSKNIEIVEKYVPQVNVSDHLPLVARIKLP